jgi:hypothetical protein
MAQLSMPRHWRHGVDREADRSLRPFTMLGILVVVLLAITLSFAVWSHGPAPLPETSLSPTPTVPLASPVAP